MQNQTIKDLFYGNISPCEINVNKCNGIPRINQQIEIEIIHLEKRLGTNNKHFDRYNTLLHKKFETLYYVFFEKGFQLGTNLTLEGLNKNTSN